MSLQEDFINAIAPIIVREAKARGYQFPSAIIGQACLESAYGESGLSKKYFNYFGLKAGKYWSGRKVNLKTQEEYTPGTYTEIVDTFRAYPDMESGVIGYFDFIKYSRYSNLKEATSALDYIQKLGADGYYTSSKYADTFIKIYNAYSLYMWDNGLSGIICNESAQPIESQSLVNDVYIQALSTAIDVVATRVIAGDYGNGDNRKAKLGQYYDLVQDRVNKICKGIG